MKQSRWIVLGLGLWALPVFTHAGLNPKALQGAGQLIQKGKYVLSALVGAGALKVIQDKLPEGEAVYVLSFNLNNDASSVYWADTFNKPDVFPVLQVAGSSTYLIPELIPEYAGQQVIWTFHIPRVPGNREIVVHLYDDDTASNKVWNSILQNRIEFEMQMNASPGSVTLNGNKLKVTGGMAANIKGGGSVQLLKENVTLDAPDYICQYRITTPDPNFVVKWWGKDRWDSQGDLKDSAGKKVGSVTFSQIISKF